MDFEVLLQVGPDQLKLKVSEHSLIHQVKQAVNDLNPCFFLSFNGERLKDFDTMGSLNIKENDIIVMQNDVYTERKAKIQLCRFREILNNPNFNNGILHSSRLSNLYATCSQDYDFFKLENFPARKLCLPELKALPKCIENLAFSCWNPPPFGRKSRGDFMYLTAKIIEGKEIEITCAESGFYVNQSTQDVFNHRIQGDAFHSLVELFSNISPKFKENYLLLSSQLSSMHPFELTPSSNTFYPWIVNESHFPDVGRSVDSSLIASEVLNTVSARDWNEDIQTSRELPIGSVAERIIRDQASVKAYKDFVHAATLGAMAIVDKSIYPVNPEEEEHYHMYIHNNIFFSRGYDNLDLFDSYGGLAAVHVAISKDIDGISHLINSDVDKVATLGTVLIDIRGHRILAQTIAPGILKSTEEDKSCLRYGSVDGGETIVTSADFEETAKKVAKIFHLREHNLLDKNGAGHSLHTSVDSKGVLGNDGRHYMLDLYRTTPIDIVFLETVERETNENPYPHKMCLIRHELMELYYGVKIRQAIAEKKEASKNDANIEVNMTDMSTVDPNVLNPFNPDSFTNMRHAIDTDVEKDEAVVREISAFVPRVITQMILDIVQYALQIPCDSRALTSLLHSRGINMRYLGDIVKILELIDNFPVSFMVNLCKQEILARSIKTVLRKYLVNTSTYKVTQCVAHIFNCLFDDSFQFDESINNIEWENATPISLRAEVLETAKQRFRYDLTDFKWNEFSVILIKEVCQKVGIQLTAKEYDFESSPVFSEEDVLNLYPIVKHATPKAAFAQDASDHARITINGGDKGLGLDLLKDSLGLFEQIYGSIDSNTAKAYSDIARHYFNEKEFDLAISHQKRSVIAYERTYGHEDSETVHQYINLAYFEYANGNAAMGLHLMKFVLQNTCFATYKYEHPDAYSALSNIGAILQGAEQLELAIAFYKRVAELNEAKFGLEHPFTTAAQEIYVQALYKTKDYRSAVKVQKHVCQSYKKRFGVEDDKTVQNEKVLRVLLQEAVEAAKGLKIS